MTQDTSTAVRTEWWPPLGCDNAEETDTGRPAYLDVERDEGDPSRIAMHTMVDCGGSLSSYYIDREQAVALAHALLGAAMIR